MPWKTDDNGSLVVEDNNPVWIYEGGKDEGKEAPVDFTKTLGTIKNLTAESIERKNKLKEANTKLEPYEAAGIEDFEEFVKTAGANAKTVANLSDKEVLDAGEVDKIKQSANEVWDKKVEALKKAHVTELAERENKLADKDAAIRNMVIKSAFDTSTFLQEKTVLPAEIAYNTFGHSFKVKEKDGKPIGYAVDESGDRLMSLRNPGEYAQPDEAIEILVDKYPQRDAILKQDAKGQNSQRSDGSIVNNPAAKIKNALKSKDFIGALARIREANEAQ